MATRYIYLIRHGKYDSTIPTNNPKGTGLIPLGIKQATLTAERLKKIPATSVFYSSMLRAEQTAKIIMRELPHTKHVSTKLIWECVPGIPSLYAESFSNVSALRLKRDEQRAHQVFTKFFKPSRKKEQHDIIVTHGNLIRYLICLSLSIPTKLWNNFAISNCGISKIQVLENGIIILLSHNDVGHLPLNLIS